MKEDAVRILQDGKVFIDYGPVSMVVSAMKDHKMMSGLCRDSFQVVEAVLEVLAGSLLELKKYPELIDEKCLAGISKTMYETVVRVGEPTLTPMATVAGAVADAVADWIFKQDVDSVLVNNGGDIAIRLKENQRIRMGIVPDLSKGDMDEVVEIKGTDGIGGVCTSGFGGRSMTRGIANSVTVFADRCIKADACATHIANCSYVPSKAVTIIRAGEEDPYCDIPDLTIVKAVGDLTKEEIDKGLSQIESETKRQYQNGNLTKVIADIKGCKYRFH
ncbi:MAG: hypothetical protein Q4B70_03440 [Lachnospiraceae bacterium]|nr:hypothetical protein [Lachnospiraceae bacterium]